MVNMPSPKVSGQRSVSSSTGPIGCPDPGRGRGAPAKRAGRADRDRDVRPARSRRDRGSPARTSRQPGPRGVTEGTRRSGGSTTSSHNERSVLCEHSDETGSAVSGTANRPPNRRPFGDPRRTTLDADVLARDAPRFCSVVIVRPRARWPRDRGGGSAAPGVDTQDHESHRCPAPWPRRSNC